MEQSSLSIYGEPAGSHEALKEELPPLNYIRVNDICPI